MVAAPARGTRHRNSRFPLPAVLLLVLLCALGQPVHAGERPAPGCSTASDMDDTSSPWCTLVSYLEAFGGRECKPELIASAVAARFGLVPEGCCGTGISFNQAFGVRLAFNGVAGARIAASSVPVVGYVRCELEYSAVQVSVRFPGWSQDLYANSSTPSFRDTMRGDVTVAAQGPDGTASVQYIGGSLYLMGNVHAEACNDGMEYSESVAIADPFLEVDPESPLATQWKVEKETSPGSGLWVEMKRDSPSVLFTRVATPTPGDTSYTAGIAWGDYDADGDLDLFVANGSNAGNRLYHNDGGTFTDVTSPALAAPGLYSLHPTWADIDNDGDLDLFMTRGSLAKHVLWWNDGPAGFRRDTTSALCFAGYGRGASWADYDRDGDLDVFIADCGTGNKLFRNDGTGHFTDATTPLLADYGCDMAGLWGDYDNDGDADLFLISRFVSTPCKLLRNDNGTFTNVTPSTGLPVGLWPSLFSGNWVDFDDDGRLDLCLSTDEGGRLYRNLGNGTFADSTNGWIQYAGLGSAVAWSDLDLDGDLDCFMMNRTQPNRIVVRYPGHFGNSMFHVGGPVDTPGVGNSVGWADYDGDGDLDLFLGYSKFKQLLRNDQALGNHWLAVDLRGIQDNRCGVGAKVRVVAGGRSQHRQVLNNDGYWSGNPLRQTFGLDSIDVVDTLEVRWPDGAVTTLAGPFGADRRVTVSQDGTVTGVEPGALYSGAPQLIGSAPNPFVQSTSIRFRLPRPMRVELVLYDIAGRRLRTLASNGEMPAGVGSLAWDGRTETGDAANPGIYFCRLRAGTFESGKNLVFRVVRVR